MPLKVIMFGKPGSGKDTQGEIMARTFGLAHFSGGQLLREEIARDTEIGRLVKPFVEQGVIIPKDVLTEIIKKKITSPDVQTSGYVVQGYPRTKESFLQYLAYDTPTHIVVLESSDDVVRARLAVRKRGDDTPNRIDRRLAEFAANDAPLIAWLEEEMPEKMVYIHADQEKENVTSEIVKCLRDKRK